MVMEDKPSVFLRVMNEDLQGVDPSTLDHLKEGIEWNEIQVTTDPFVVYRNKKYLPVVLIEDIGTIEKRLLFISALSLGKIAQDMIEEKHPEPVNQVTIA